MLRLGDNGKENANKSINFNKTVFYNFYEIATNLFICNFEIKARMLFSVSTMHLVVHSKLRVKHILKVSCVRLITFTSSNSPQWCCAQQKCFQRIVL